MLVLGIKRRSQHLHKDNDGAKARARVLRKGPSMETILSVDTAWPWQLQHTGMYTCIVSAYTKSD